MRAGAPAATQRGRSRRAASCCEPGPGRANARAARPPARRWAAFDAARKCYGTSMVRVAAVVMVTATATNTATSSNHHHRDCDHHWHSYQHRDCDRDLDRNLDAAAAHRRRLRRGRSVHLGLLRQRGLLCLGLRSPRPTLRRAATRRRVRQRSACSGARGIRYRPGPRRRHADRLGSPGIQAAAVRAPALRFAGCSRAPRAGNQLQIGDGCRTRFPGAQGLF